MIKFSPQNIFVQIKMSRTRLARRWFPRLPRAMVGCTYFMHNRDCFTRNATYSDHLSLGEIGPTGDSDTRYAASRICSGRIGRLLRKADYPQTISCSARLMFACHDRFLRLLVAESTDQKLTSQPYHRRKILQYFLLRALARRSQSLG